jgi:DNA repair exonuclease SbcCD ATPase subunit
MKLSKALKEKKRLIGEIERLKRLIQSKNSYVEGSNVPEKFDVNELYAQLQSKIQELVNLKIVINEANKEIQSSIYLLGEYKALINFFNMLNTTEGPQESFRSEKTINYHAQIDELKKEELIKQYQDKADRLQDQIDTYNYTTEIDWGDNYTLKNYD